MLGLLDLMLLTISDGAPAMVPPPQQELRLSIKNNSDSTYLLEGQHSNLEFIVKKLYLQFYYTLI